MVLQPLLGTQRPPGGAHRVKVAELRFPSIGKQAMRLNDEPERRSKAAGSVPPQARTAARGETHAVGAQRSGVPYVRRTHPPAPTR